MKTNLYLNRTNTYPVDFQNSVWGFVLLLQASRDHPLLSPQPFHQGALGFDSTGSSRTFHDNHVVDFVLLLSSFAL